MGQDLTESSNTLSNRKVIPACRSNRGQAMVEFAMVVPLFFLLIFGMIDIGRLFFVQVTLQNAMRQAGRYAVTGNNMANQTRVQSIVQTARQAAVGIDVTSIQINGLNPTNTNASAGGPGAMVTISMTSSLQLFTPMIGRFFGTNGVYSFTVSTTFRNERFPP